MQQELRYWLMFELVGTMASYGGVAPGTVRDTDLLPSRSAILGLLAAALGIERHEVQCQRALGKGLWIAARVNAWGSLLRDYHTAQAPREAALKGRPRMTRQDEMCVPRGELNTVLSDRYYYTDYATTIGIAACDSMLLERLGKALRAPRFTLYLGRKSCPPAWPLDPHCLEAETWTEALKKHDARVFEQLTVFDGFGIAQCWLRNAAKRGIHRWDEGINPGEIAQQPHYKIRRRDDPMDTLRRLFAECSHWRAGTGGQHELV